MSQRDESLALRLLKKHRELVRPIFSKYGGREVKTMGDAFLVEFASALDATECAVEVQRTLRAYSLKAGKKLQVRIGIHVGDVVDQDGDVYGDAVNIASRIEPLADGGEICISQQVYDQVRNKLTYPLVELASQNLKNVTFPIDVYKVVLPWKEAKHLEAEAEPAVSMVRKYQPEKQVEKNDHSSLGKYFLKLTLKNRIAVVTLTNDPTITRALAKFSGEVDYSRGETLHIVAGIETVMVVTDSKNLEKLSGSVPKKRFLKIINDLSEIVISLSESVMNVPGVVAGISTHLAKSGISLVEYITINPHMIIVVKESDALKSYQVLEDLAMGGKELLA